MTTSPSAAKGISRLLVALGTVAWLIMAILVSAVWWTADDTQDASNTARNAIVVNRRLIRENHRLLLALGPHLDADRTLNACRSAAVLAVEQEWREAVEQTLHAYIANRDVDAALIRLAAAAHINVLSVVVQRCPG